MMTSVADRVDSLALELLDVLTAIQSCRKDADKLISNGHLSLSQARYSRGVKSVSTLQFPLEMSATTTASIQNDKNGIQINLHRETTESAIVTPTHTQNDPSSEAMQLRHRKGHTNKTEVETVSSGTMIEAKKEEKKVTKAIHSDPLKWFGVLVPQSLRSAKKSFSEGVETVVQLANLQMKLERLRTEYQQLLKKKAEMVGK